MTQIAAKEHFAGETAGRLLGNVEGVSDLSFIHEDLYITSSVL